MSKLSGSPELNPLGEELSPFDEEETHMTEEEDPQDRANLELDPLGGELGPFNEDEDPHDRPHLELDPLGGTPLGCRSCLCWGTSQVQPAIGKRQSCND